MSSNGFSEEDVAQYTEILKQRFLQQHTDNDIDPRDLEKVRNDPVYVARFVRHNRGDLDNAYNHMIECHRWRKSFGINDIRWEDLDDALWRSGMAWNRGLDKDGNDVCILNIHMHKKDAKKAPLLQKWIAYSFEMQRKVYPNNKMCMIFDMTGAGLAQMDMDLVKFVVNSFKIYFPNLLAWLLIYNMPWILQAAWKIVQGWLSEGAAAKVKFVTNDTIKDYIPLDQLLVKFGGRDTWVFDCDVEKDRLMQLARSVEDKQPNGEADDDLFQDDIYEQEEGESITQGQTERGRQVRFSSGLPPTRQSRFGHDDELEDNRSISPQQQALQKGTASSRGFRRRQVSRLMSLQETKERKSGMQRSASLMTEEEGEESGLMNGSLPTLRRHSADPSSGSVATIGDVMLSPSVELTFIGKKDTEVTCTLTLTNTSDNTVLYKIKTTAPTRYKVRPNLAMVDGKSVAKVQVMFTPGTAKTSVSQDKFLVQTYTFPPETNLPDMSRLIEFWRSLSEQDIREHRMRCRWLSDGPPKPALKETSSLTRDTVKKGTIPETQLTPADRQMRNLDQKITTLTGSNAELSNQLAKLQTLNYVIILLLIIVLMAVYFY